MSNGAKGQVLVDTLTKWLAGYMFLEDKGYALVAALWAINTWVFERLYACPYLSVTSDTICAGKTRMIELLELVSRNGVRFVSGTPSYIFRTIQQHESKLTLFFDDAEGRSGPSGQVIRNLMETGSRRGETVPWSTPGGKFQPLVAYCPKCFAITGELNKPLRERSIEIRLQRGNPARHFDHSAATAEAAGIVEQIRVAFEHGFPVASPPAFLTGREHEIWASLFGVAEAFRLNAETMDTLTRTAADLVARKIAPREPISREEYERRARDKSDGERAVRDLAAVLPPDEPSIPSAIAVQRMKAILTAPWRAFRGTGLDEVELERLVAPYGLQPKVVKAKHERKGQSTKAYSAHDVQSVRQKMADVADVGDQDFIVPAPPAPALQASSVQVTRRGELIWLEELPDGGVRRLFEHLAVHGAVTESEAAVMLGGARGLRRFTLDIASFAKKVPFSVRIEVVAGVKRYVREGRDR
jgi:hypothetical protein